MARCYLKYAWPLVFIALSGWQMSTLDSSLGSLPAIYEPTSYRMSYKQLRQSNGYKSATPTIGDVPMLVIPVSFSDYPCEDLLGGCSGIKDDIETAFFASEDDILWHSVTSFYETSSYGKLRFYGEVSPWYVPTVTAEQLLSGGSFDVTRDVMRPAITWYRETYHDDLKRFDSDDDGFIDAVYFVYSVPANAKEEIFVDENRVFWAYTKYDNGGIASTDRPSVFHYGWSSYDFMYKDGYYERDEQGRLLRDDNDEPVFHPWTNDQGALHVDAHTFIHEIGHFLGLPDYYSYDASLGDWGSAGGIDMMDYNIGDHNGFSKAIYGWVTPKVINDTTTLTLRPLVNHPDVAIVPIKYEGTLLDEYLLIEYYRNDGLNYKDSQQPFAGYYPRTFSIPGVKIYHVDARAGRFIRTSSGFVFSSYVKEIGVRTASVYYGLANSNSASRSAIAQNKLITLLQPDGSWRLRHGYVATNQSLFVEGMSFSEHNFPNFTFNSGTEFPYTITISQLSEQSVNIAVTPRTGFPI